MRALSSNRFAFSGLASISSEHRVELCKTLLICSNRLRFAASASTKPRSPATGLGGFPCSTETPSCHVRYILDVRFERIWVEQCRATKAIKRRFGAKSALDYLIGEKLLAFADAAREHPTFAKELPGFLAGIWQVFNEYEIAGYVASRRPIARKRLRQLLYLR